MKFNQQDFSDFGIPANLIDTSLDSSKIPNRIRDEIPTLNQYGYMKEEFDIYSKAFVDTSCNNNLPVLEIGPAYGWVLKQTLEKGAQVIANDISKEHLAIIVDSIRSDNAMLNKLFVYPGAFPGEIELPNDSIGSVLVSRVFHFLDVEDINIGLKKIHNWLIDGGKLYFTACSVYHDSIREQILDIFQAKFNNGELWPGRVTNHKKVTKSKHLPYTQDFFHVFDIPQLEKIIPKYGFKIDHISLFDYPNDTDSMGKGHIGFVATKEDL